MDVVSDVRSFSFRLVKRGTIALLMAMPAIFRLEREWYTARDQLWVWGRLVRRTHVEDSPDYQWEDIATGRSVKGKSEEHAQRKFANMLIANTLFTLSPAEWNASMQELQPSCTYPVDSCEY